MSYIDLVGNGCIDIKDMSGFVNLESLSLNRASLFDNSFQGLTYLESLNLFFCNFENFKSESFRYLLNLEKLKIMKPKNFINVNFNELTKLKNLSICVSLKIFESLKHDNV